MCSFIGASMQNSCRKKDFQGTLRLRILKVLSFLYSTQSYPNSKLDIVFTYVTVGQLIIPKPALPSHIKWHDIEGCTLNNILSHSTIIVLTYMKRATNSKYQRHVLDHFFLGKLWSQNGYSHDTVLMKYHSVEDFSLWWVMIRPGKCDSK